MVLVALCLLASLWIQTGSAAPPEEPIAAPCSALIVRELAGDYPAKGELIALHEAGREKEHRVPFEIPVGQSSVEVPLPLSNDGSWWLTITGANLYARRELIACPAVSGPIRIGLRPLATLTGHISIAGAPALEKGEAQVRWRRPSSSSSWEGMPISVSGGKFEASLPAGVWDLSVKVTGYASIRRENVQVAPNAVVNLGPITVVPGASLIGRLVEGASGKAPVAKGIRATLAPVGEIPDASSLGGGVTLGQEARPSPSGEFQFTGLPGGRFNLRIFGTGFAREDRQIDLVPDKEIEFRDPIVLAKPAILQLDLTPPMDPRERNWIVEIREIGEAGWLKGALVSKKTVAGLVTFEDVRLEGQYSVAIRAGNGDIWRVEAIAVDAARTRRTLRVDSTQVVGRVTLGPEPLVSRLIFGGRKAAPAVTAESGQDGEFQAELPHPGAWRVAIDSATPMVTREVVVDVARPEDGLPARVDISLPTTKLEISVVDPAGKLVTEPCLVRLESILTHESETSQTRSGMVVHHGLEAGEWLAYAETRGAVSEKKTVRVSEDGQAAVTLILERRRVVEGVVITTLGQPVPYARLQLLRFDTREDVFPAPVMSDALGRFRLQVPSNVSRVGMLVLAPGYAVTSAVLTVGESAPVPVEVPTVGGRVFISFDPKVFPSPFLPFVSDGSVTYAGLLLRSSPEIREEHKDGRIVVEIPAYRAGHFAICRSVLASASDVDSVGKDCVSGPVSPDRDLFLDLK